MDLKTLGYIEAKEKYHKIKEKENEKS